MTNSKTCLYVISFFFVSLPSFAGETRDAVKGYWAGPDSIFSVYEENDQLHTKVLTLVDDPYYENEGTEKAGLPRRDDNNPDPVLRARPIEGMSFIEDYTFKSNKWQGAIYDPGNGKTFKSHMTVERDGRLKIRGYIGAPMFGQTQMFDAASSCKAHIISMLQKPKNAALCQEICPAECEI